MKTSKTTKFWIFRNSDVVFYIRYGTTENSKICSDPKQVIIQTMTYSKAQFDYIKASIEMNFERSMKDFFSLADSNCLDCPFNVYGKCYTHKYRQYAAFVSQLKATYSRFENFETIPYLSAEMQSEILDYSEQKYVRFGTYGEPSLLPIELVQNMAKVSSTFTGYTHQWDKPKFQKFSAFLMASTHNLVDTFAANSLGFRCFQVIEDRTKLDKTKFVHCPASDESGSKTSCNKCKLCGGTSGTKVSKNTAIYNHAN